MILASCASTSYFQVYKATPLNKTAVKGNELVYEDDNCKINYNLWDNGGNVGFEFYNKTDKNIYINLEESFFILNNVAYNYFRNRVFTSSSSAGASATNSASASKSVTGVNLFDLIQTNRIAATNSIGLMTSSGFSVSFNEERFVCIPSKTSKIIAEYKINKSIFRDCGLYKYPSRRQIKTLKLTKTESPIVFSNRLTYSLGDKDGSYNRVENEFYVSEITNYPENAMYVSKYDEFCGKKNIIPSKYYKDVSADKFYIKYSKDVDNSIH